MEAVSGQTLEQYFQQNILEPLGMSGQLSSACFGGEVRPPGEHSSKTERDSRSEDPARCPRFPKPSTGAALYSTAGDYVRFMQMILRKGKPLANKSCRQRPWR